MISSAVISRLRVDGRAFPRMGKVHPGALPAELNLLLLLIIAGLASRWQESGGPPVPLDTTSSAD